MNEYIITGKRQLAGVVSISGAKNSSLPILAGSLLATKPTVLRNIPHKLQDVITMLELLTGMGVKTTHYPDGSLGIDNTLLNNPYAPYDKVSKMRASIVVLGPLLARFGVAKVSLPGGCAIGARPVNLHVDNLRLMGAQINIENGYIMAAAPNGLSGAELSFNPVTVTGTENLLMAATLASGTTVLHNAAKEPEVVDLAQFLIKMGAKITGAGTDTIVVEGVKELLGCEYHILPDRVEAGTYLIAAAITRGKIKVVNVAPLTLTSVLEKLRETGAVIEVGEDWISLDMQGKRPHAVDICTMPYPGIATDLQAQFMALNAVAEGNSVIEESIFENRFMHVQELCRMGADIKISGNKAFCVGQDELSGAQVMATDLRAGAGLVLAGLVANGNTTISKTYHLDRGYENIQEKLVNLGALIERLEV